MAMKSVECICVFCGGLLAGRPGKPWDQVLAETAEYLVVPTKGALLPGWVLIVSKRHALCTGAIEGVNQGLMEAISATVDLLRTRFRCLTFFEHGPVVDGSELGCGIDHLHIHAAPLEFSLRQATDTFFGRLKWNTVDGWSELRQVHRNGIEYLAVQEPDGLLHWTEAPAGVRQPLRQVIASAAGFGNRYDYRKYPELHNVARTIEALALS